MTTAFYWDERCFWHGGGNYALTLPVGGFVQPMNAGLPESPETKRRLKNLAEVSGLWAEMRTGSAPGARWEELARVHPESYLTRFKSASDAGGGELGLRTPFSPGGFEIAALSAGLAVEALRAVLKGEVANAYALSRPPGHHCLPDWPNGFCLMANIAIAIETARAEGRAARVAVVDWDVHHGNGTEAIFLNNPEVLTISLHQEANYPLDTGQADVRGEGAAKGSNINVPLPPGLGHKGYIAAMERIVLPALHRFQPDVIVVACGYDASAFDPLGRMLATTETFRQMTAQVKAAAQELCAGRLVLVHEGGYSEVHVPFCGHAVLEELTGSAIRAPDPMARTLEARQPNARFDAFAEAWIDELALYFDR
ncbi:class II histone deacetylase [Xinfangfangia sp. CPCC 101601]|uniref:Class II histone deacetylase n=1 Tax=Pseudogemmobacter lacusdianii TaxID=3069608 RepID=A0ABU0VU69_9RHOB|nr:class II histone deacetylase [Xinfangfangia sp. CPCC 101601]MDQ2064810.1 class II histone deacetylase [Xinfangfangia sp. CPCC 101601]